MSRTLDNPEFNNPDPQLLRIARLLGFQGNRSARSIASMILEFMGRLKVALLDANRFVDSASRLHLGARRSRSMRKGSEEALPSSRDWRSPSFDETKANARREYQFADNRETLNE